jgi:threonine dehydrogenase-like Zn-dependent dehydrogenase
MDMQAAVYSGIGSIEYREVEKPVIGNNEALVKVKAAAICGTDLRIFKSGHFAIKEGEERIMCHEFSGEICELGPDVTTYKKGMRVSVASSVGCGVCRYCRMGSIHLCPEYIAFGISIDGAFAEYVKLPQKTVLQGNMIPFDEGTSFEEAALAEPLACCYNAYKSVGTLPGDNVLIVGAGPMGVLHMQVNKLAGAGKVMMADVSEPRLKLIEKYGPDVIINTEKEDLKEAVMKNTGGKGADVVITACPAPDIQQQSIELTAKLGKINLFGGLPKGKEHVPLNTNLIHYNGIIVTGTTGASIAHHQAALELITSKQVDTKSLISKRFKLSQIKEAFKYAMSGEGMKTIIEI